MLCGNQICKLNFDAKQFGEVMNLHSYSDSILPFNYLSYAEQLQVLTNLILVILGILLYLCISSVCGLGNVEITESCSWNCLWIKKKKRKEKKHVLFRIKVLLSQLIKLSAIYFNKKCFLARETYIRNVSYFCLLFLLPSDFATQS